MNTATAAEILVHREATSATVLAKSARTVTVAVNGTAAFIETYSLRKSGRWVRVGDPDVWGAHRLQGV